MDITSPGAGLPHHGSKCLQRNGLFHLPNHACTHLLLSSPTKALREMLHTWHETHSRGKGPAPQDEPDTQVQHQQLLHRGSLGPLLFLWQMKSSLVPYKPLPRSPEHKGDKNDRAALGEEDSEKPHTAKGSWALLCGRGNTAQTQQTTPSLTTLSPDFRRRGLSSL